MVKPILALLNLIERSDQKSVKELIAELNTLLKARSFLSIACLFDAVPIETTQPVMMTTLLRTTVSVKDRLSGAWEHLRDRSYAELQFRNYDVDKLLTGLLDKGE